MLLAFALLATLPDLAPARWPANAVKSLDLIRDTPINCLLLEQPQWSSAFVAAAAGRGVATFAVIRPQGDPLASARRAAEMRFTGAVLEGNFEPAVTAELRKFLAASKLQTVELGPRSQMEFADPVAGTYEGLWPGVQADDGAQKAAPSGGPWIDTNTGFLRFVRASTRAAVWLANTPPPGKTIPVERYLQAIGDAAMTGARWVIALDDETSRKLLAADPAAVAGWKRMMQTVRYYEEHKDWRAAEPFARLALIEDAGSGALLSGGVLDMIAVKHTPVRPVPKDRLEEALLSGVAMAVNVDSAALNDHQRDVLRVFTRAGGTLLSGPPGWRFPAARAGRITLEKEDLGKLDEIWKELNSMTGRKNLGARLFNVSTMLSNLLETPDRKQVILQLVNYSDFPVENVTVHVLGKYRAGRLYRPDGAAVELAPYEVEEGSGFDIERVNAVATLVLSR